jgi:hypothetical protein
MTWVVKFKHKDWHWKYQFLTPCRTGSYLKANAEFFDDKRKAQEVADRNRERNPDAFFRIELL